MLHIKNRKQKTENRKQWGVSILFAVLIMSIILAIGLGISFISLQQTKMMREVGYSVIAFYAADNGIEEVLMTETLGNIPETILPNGAKYEVSVRSPGADCDAENYCIKSIGTYKETRRAIEIRF